MATLTEKQTKLLLALRDPETEEGWLRSIRHLLALGRQRGYQLWEDDVDAARTLLHRGS